MLEEYVHHYSQEGFRSLTNLPTHLQWWTNPFHTLGILGGMYLASRKEMNRKATLGLAASVLSVTGPELSDLFESMSKSPDYTPLFASFMTSVVTTFPFLTYNLARAEWDEFNEKGYVPGSPTLTRLFDFMKEHPRLVPFAVQKTTEHVTNGAGELKHTLSNVVQSARTLGKNFTSRLATVGAIAGAYLLYRAYQTMDLPFVNKHLLEDTSHFIYEHPSIALGTALGGLTGYLQKPYDHFSAWSGVATVPVVSALQCTFNPSYSFADYGNEMFIGMPLAFAAHVAGRGIRSVQHSLFSK